MARIYRAEHEGLRRQVALKVLTNGVAPGTEGRARFLREARIAAAIKHPNVVNIFDVGVHNHVPYLVMELLVGQDLEALLRSHGALNETSIVDIIIPVVAGLVAVHDAGVIHRDLKPGNIFLSNGFNDEVEPKLLDFGISKAIGRDKHRLTSVTQGLLIGTPLYMSPEALLGTEMTALSDQYSLGVVLYECASGINPFIANSVAETARRVTAGEYTPLASRPSRPSRRLASIIERAMSVNPTHRFPDMRSFGQELLALAGQRTRITWSLTFDEVAAAARAHHALAVGGNGPAGTRRRHASGFGRWSAAAAGFVALASVSGLLMWALSRAPVPAAPVAEGSVTTVSAAVMPAAPALAAQRPEPRPADALAESPGLDLQSALERSAVALGHHAEERVVDEAAKEVPVDEQRANRQAPRPARPRPVPAPAAEAQTAAEPSEPAAKEVSLPPPDWMFIPRDVRAPRPTPKPPEMGTNLAPIFD